jgi:hypothetical protein
MFQCHSQKRDSAMSERLKAAAYDELAELCVKAKMKALRSGDGSDITAIVREYFEQSVAIMRRTGLAIRVESPALADRVRRVG